MICRLSADYLSERRMLAMVGLDTYPGTSEFAHYDRAWHPGALDHRRWHFFAYFSLDDDGKRALCSLSL